MDRSLLYLPSARSRSFHRAAREFPQSTHPYHHSIKSHIVTTTILLYYPLFTTSLLHTPAWYLDPNDSDDECDL